MSWAEDPELLATFRAEVEERLASLSAGLLQLEGEAAPRQLVGALFRDAHTIKGSARMLGAGPMLHLAHACEDTLGALRDGRRAPDRAVVDELLAACDAMAALLPGDSAPATAPVSVSPPAVPPQAVSSTPVPPEAAVATAAPQAAVSTFVPPQAALRVSAAKVYGLVDDVGEAELAVRRLDHALPADARPLREALEHARGRLAQVREGAMGLAMVPVRRVTAGLPRLVRDVAAATGKDVALVVEGEDVELDKQVLDAVADSLKHLVTNAVDHGCERPDRRAASGKPARATVTVRARSAGDHVVLEVADDGAGIDPAALRATALARGLAVEAGRELRLLFTPGFTTAPTVTETSGRGVGLDVVQSAVEALGGAVEVRSDVGVGTAFTLTLPVTLGVLHCLLARVGDERYALPVASVVESVSLRHLPVHDVAGAAVVVRHGATLPLLDLGAALGALGERDPRAAVVARHGDKLLAWAVDRLDGEQQLVVKDLGPFLGASTAGRAAVTGATIDADGSVVLIVDVRELAAEAHDRRRPATPDRRQPALLVQDSRAQARRGLGGWTRDDNRAAVAARRPRVLVVEDSVGVRELERVILEAAGYDVTTAVDGLEGAARLRDEPADLVLSDVEMPGMDGFTLTRTIRATPGWEHVPVLIMTSRGSDDDQRAGLDAGASAYLLKSEFDQSQLVDTVRRLVGR